jgi:hypothetical protein
VTGADLGELSQDPGGADAIKGKKGSKSK